MAVGDLDIERVTALSKRSVAELVLPSFRRLGPDDVERKLTPSAGRAQGTQTSKVATSRPSSRSTTTLSSQSCGMYRMIG